MNQKHNRKESGRAFARPTLFLAAIMLIPGCITNGVPTVDVPAMPSSFQGEFEVFINDVQVDTLSLSGVKERPFLLGDGTRETGPAMEIMLHPENENEAPREMLHFLGANGTLVSATISCTQCSELDKHFTFIPDAFGRGALFGFGILMSRQLAPGSSLALESVTQQGPLPLSVTVSAAPPMNGSPCVFADVHANRQPIAPLLFVSDAGRFLACDGIPFPLLVETSAWTIKFITGSWEGQLNVSGSAPPMPKNVGCGFAEPPSNETVLATTDFMAWAATADPYVRDWLSRNPDGIVKAGYGRTRFPDWDTTVNTYLVGTMIPFQDRNGSVEMRYGFESHQFLNPGRYELEREYLPSEEIQKIGKKAHRLPGTECSGPPIELETMADLVVPLMPYDEFVNVYAAPDLLAPIQKSHSLLGPFRSGSVSLRDYFLDQPQPDVVFVTTAYRGGGYRAPGASVSTDGLIRFVDVDAADWLRPN